MLNWITSKLTLLVAISVVTSDLLRKFFSHFFSTAWDGSGHQAIAYIYSQNIFPNIYGWSNEYFGGLPFPNFYPPVFYWCVGLLNRLVSFETAFKFVIFLPSFLLPFILWRCIYSLTNKNQIAAWAGTVGGLFLLLDARFIFVLPAGLDFFSTFQIGLYTQPLGFIFLLLWYVNFEETVDFNWRFSLSTILLALTVLSNFFAGAAATLMAAIVIFKGIFVWYQSYSEKNINENQTFDNEKTDEKSYSTSKKLSAQVLSSFLALCLTLFWLVPLTSQYEYFTTRPFIVETNHLLSSAWWIWFVLAAFGFYIWYLKQTKAFWSFTISCLILALSVAFATLITPDWFPLQSPRILAILNFLLVVPVGLAISSGFRWFAKLLGEIKHINEPFAFGRFKYTLGISAFLLIILILSSPGTGINTNYTFVAKGEKPEIEQILNFAKQHTDGRYLVEVINLQKTPAYTDAAFDARAINAYLGSNGNETLSAVFHESSPHSLFMLPVINSLSDYSDSFGISSVLSDDLDFQAQPIEKHIERAKFLGVKYLVIRTPAMKEKLLKVNEIAQKYDFGWWTIYELKTESDANPTAKILANRPALILSDFTLKARYRNDLNYIRFVEEQFADGWFDLLLARSLETNIDKLSSWENFGAFIINDYHYGNEVAAYEKIKEIAQTRIVILISSEDDLFKKIQQNKTEFPKLEIVERPVFNDTGEMLKSDHPSFHYNGTPIREMWKKIRQILEANKVPTEVGQTSIGGQKLQNQILINLQSDKTLPILVTNTFHPNWKRTDEQNIYPVTPFYQLTFANQPLELKFERKSFDKIGLSISAIVLLGIVIFTIYQIITVRLRQKSKI